MKDCYVALENAAKFRVLGVGGSPRRRGNSDILLRRFLDGARREGAEVEGVHLRDYDFRPCIGCETCRKKHRCEGLNDGMQLLYPKIIASRGLILISPTHNYNVTAWMKAFIDRLYCFYDFDGERPGPWSSRLSSQGRKAVVATVCEQEDPRDMGFTLEAMRLPLEALGYEVIGELSVYRTFERGKVKEDPEALLRARDLGKDLARSLL